MLDTVTRRAPAKINWTLDVGLARADGFHDVRTVMQTLALADVVTVTRTPNSPGVTLTVTGDEAAGVPSDASNLVWQAAVRMQKVAAARTGTSAGELGVHIDLVKHIPSQAGLGGGSSDAASVLSTLDNLWGLNLSTKRLAEMAATLGSDVPFFMVGGTCLCEGRGEKVTPLPPPPFSWPLLIVKPEAGVSTQAAYAALDNVPHRAMGTATDRYLSDPHNTMPANDFEQVVYALYPAIDAARDTLERFGLRPHLCGSGAALFCRMQSASDAVHLAKDITALKLGKVWVTHTENALDPNT